LITGRVGDDVSVEDANAAARLIGLNLVSTMRHATGGDLDKVKRVVKLVGFVRCTEKFIDQPKVINGCSDLLVEIFGPEKGKHARSAVGTNALPLGVAVEIEAIIELEP
jgi:enamine deaminase RidA (YjgF/YER057c/UK114 family)